MKTASEIILPFDQNTGKKLFLSSHDLSPPQADLFSAAAPEVEGHSQSDCSLTDGTGGMHPAQAPGTCAPTSARD